jgi:hypothetical protein
MQASIVASNFALSSWFRHLLILAASRASFDLRVVGINITSKEVQALALPFVFWRALHEDASVVIDVGLQLSSRIQVSEQPRRRAAPF